MSEKHKQVFRKIEQDKDVRSLLPGDYRNLINGIPVQPANTQSTLKDVIASICGNSTVTNAALEANSVLVGFLEDRVGNRAFFCVYNSNNNHTIYKYESGAISTVMRTSLFGFSATDYVDMDIIGDILIFTNNVGEIKKIDVVKAAAGTVYTPLTAAIITLIKPPPLLPLTWALSYDNAVYTNKLTGHYFQFYYRYIYENYDYSVFSPASKTTNSWDITGLDTARLLSASDIASLSGEKTIDSVTTSASKVILIGQTDPLENGVWVTAAGAWARHASYPAGTTIDATLYVTSGELFAGSLWRLYGLNPGTTDTSGIQLDGPNKLTVTRPTTPPVTVIGIEYAVRIDGSNEFTVYIKEKTGYFSSSHSFYNNQALFTVPDSESLKWNDSVPVKSKSVRFFKNRLFTFNNTEGYDVNQNTSLAVGLTATAVSGMSPPTGNRVYTCAKAGASYNVGVVFFDGNRRLSSVMFENKITLPNDAYVITVDTSALAGSSPSWATHFSIVCTKALEMSFFISQWTQDIYYFKKDEDGTYTYKKSLTNFDATGTLIDIGALTKDQRGYTFSLGDRVKLYVYEFDSYTGVGAYRVLDVPILGQVGRFVQTRVIGDLPTLDTSRSTNIRFEIYSPKVSTIEPYYEIGLTYAIASLPFLSVNLQGDVERVLSNVYRDVSGDYSPTNPYANTYEVDSANLLKTFVDRMNMWDSQTWVTQSGRGLIKSDSQQINKKSYVRHSQPYIPNSTVLGLNTFNALDEYALPVELGIGTLLKEAGDVLVAVFERETSAIYVGDGFVSTSEGNGFLAKTDSVIGDDRRYTGGMGSQHPNSIVSREGRVWFYDHYNGVICRRSQDGITAISDYGLRGLLGYIKTLYDTSGGTIAAGYDPQYECYTITFNLTGFAYTLYFHEKTNSWVCFSSLLPDWYGILGMKQITFKNGALWLQTPGANYNTWFGVSYNRTLEWEIAPLESLVKILEAIEVDVTSIYSAGTTEDIVKVYLVKGGTLETRINYHDFKIKDGVYRSAFFQTLNDASFGSVTESKYKSPYKPRNQSFYLTIVYNGTDVNIMKSITTFFRAKMNSFT